MRQKLVSVLLIYLLIGGAPLVAEPVSEAVKSRQYAKAFSLIVSAPHYIVINVINKKTGEQKDICVDAMELLNALEVEHGIKDTFKAADIALANKRRRFIFKNKKAIAALGFNRYTPEELEEYAKGIDVAQIKAEVMKERPRENGDLKSRFHEYKEQLMYAHVLFDNGIVTGRGCYTPDLYYSYVSDEEK